VFISNAATFGTDLRPVARKSGSAIIAMVRNNRAVNFAHTAFMAALHRKTFCQTAIIATNKKAGDLTVTGFFCAI